LAPVTKITFFERSGMSATGLNGLALRLKSEDMYEKRARTVAGNTAWRTRSSLKVWKTRWKVLVARGSDTICREGMVAGQSLCFLPSLTNV